MTFDQLFTTVPDWLIWAGAIAVTSCLAAAAVVLHRLRWGLPVIESVPQQPVPWDGGDVLLVLISYVAAATLAATTLGRQPTLQASLAANVLINAAVTLITTAWLIQRGACRADLGVPSLRLRRSLGLAVVGLALVLAPLLAMAAALNAIVTYDHQVVALLGAERDPWSVIVVVLAAVVAAPVAEEFFFRSILLGWLDKRFPSRGGTVAITASAAAFALAHQGQGLAYLPLFTLGIVLGFMAHRTGSIVPCILLHALFNAVSVGLLLADPGLTAAGSS